MIIPKGSNPTYQIFQSKCIHLIGELSRDYEWEITAKRYKKKRSNPANNYHWGVVVETICKDTGNDKNDIHEYLLGEHVGWETYDVLGTLKKRPVRRSHNMTSEEFEDFNEWCRAWAAQNLGMVIPMPGETVI